MFLAFKTSFSCRPIPAARDEEIRASPCSGNLLNKHFASEKSAFTLSLVSLSPFHRLHPFCLQVQTRIANERYLRAHPELRAMLRLFVRCALNKRSFSLLKALKID